MKKQVIVIAAIILIVAAAVTAAILLKRDPVTDTHSQTNDEQPAAAVSEAGEQKQLNIFTFDKELEEIIARYAKMHPEFNYKIVSHETAVNFFYDLNHSLQNHDGSKVDLYCLPAQYAHWYIKGDYSQYACTYKELGIDVDAALKKADIPQSIIDAGTRPDGELIALPYKKSVNLFMYRRSIAKDIWGTDDPDRIADIIGSGTGKWDKFMEAAQTVKEHGAYMLANPLELAGLIETSAYASSLSEVVYDIDPKWEEFTDISKYLLDNDCSTFIPLWSDEYIKVLDGAGTSTGTNTGINTSTNTGTNTGAGKANGDKPVFGFFTNDQTHRKVSMKFVNTAGDWAACLPPISVDAEFYSDNYTGIMVNKDSPNKDALGPLIEWLTLDCSETGLQYILANDKLVDKNDQHYVLSGGKRAVVSGSLLKNTECSVDLLGGQNINPVIYDALHTQMGRRDIQDIERAFFGLWLEQTRAYIYGEKDRETAAADYKKAEKELISWFKKKFEEYGISFLLPN